MQKELPLEEFRKRISHIQKKLAEENLDALLTYGDEAEPQNVRYFSDYWPAFETAGVLIPAEGESYLLIGPESMAYAKDRSKINNIESLLEYRESSEPEYPGVHFITYEELFKKVEGSRKIKRVGLVGYSIMPTSIYKSLDQTLNSRNGEIVRADKIVLDMRKIKSKDEINLQREAWRITRTGIDHVMENIKPGITEIQAIAYAHNAIRANGGETEGYPLWCISGEKTNQAISRPTHRKIQKDEIVLVQVGAKLGGYASSIGRPFAFGNPPKKMRDLLKVGLEAEKLVCSSMKTGMPARDIDLIFRKFLKENKFEEFYLYGPAHGCGLMESEFPWIESSSDYLLEENMTFCLDIFLGNNEFGLRWEDGVRITKSGVENYSKIEDGIWVL